MVLNNITMISKNGEDRILFDSFTEQNDLNKDTGKVGVRCHHWFTAFFLWLFCDKIVYLTAADGTVYNVNKNSYNNWLARHKNELNIVKPELPTAEEIVAKHKEVLEAAKAAKEEMEAKAQQEKIEAEAKAEQEKKESDAATLIQSAWRGKLVRMHFPSLKSVKGEIDQLRKNIAEAEKTIKEAEELLESDIEGLEEKKSEYQAKIKELETKHQQLLSELEAKKLVIKNIKADISKQSALVQKTSLELNQANATSNIPKKAAVEAKKNAEAAKAKLEASRKGLEAKLEAAKAAGAESKEKNAVVDFFKGIVKDTPSEIEAKISTAGQKIEALEVEIKGFAQQIEKLSTPIATISEKLETYQEALESLKETLKGEERAAAELEASMDEDQAHNIKCYKELNHSLQPLIKKLHEGFAQLKAENEEVIATASAALVQKLSKYDEIHLQMKGVAPTVASPKSESKDEVSTVLSKELKEDVQEAPAILDSEDESSQSVETSLVKSDEESETVEEQETQLKSVAAEQSETVVINSEGTENVKQLGSMLIMDSDSESEKPAYEPKTSHPMGESQSGEETAVVIDSPKMESQARQG